MITRRHALDLLKTLERVGCQFQYCDGPELPARDMVTCFACAEIARLRVALGRRPRRRDELTWSQRYWLNDAREMARATGRQFTRQDRRRALAQASRLDSR